jgi:hypothetical protein
MSGGTRLSGGKLLALAAALSPHDQAVMQTLQRVRLASGVQLVRLHFADRPHAAVQARRHLARLVEQRLLCALGRRIGGVRAGSSGYVYALDVVGQRLVELDRPSGARRPWTPTAAFLAHTLAVTELYVGLTEAERRGDVEVLDFASEPRCWRSFADLGGRPLVLKPDAYLRLGVGRYEDRWFVEIDRGTEAPVTLARKCDRYRSYWQSGREQATHGVFPKVLFVVPDERRKAVVVDVLVRQPTDAWPLFQVVMEDAALRVLSGGRP